jgi:hypothetical protein
MLFCHKVVCMDAFLSQGCMYGCFCVTRLYVWMLLCHLVLDKGPGDADTCIKPSHVAPKWKRCNIARAADIEAHALCAVFTAAYQHQHAGSQEGHVCMRSSCTHIKICTSAQVPL